MAAGSPPSVAADPARVTRPTSVPLVGGARLPLAFIGLGLALLATAVGLTVVMPGLLLLPPHHPYVTGLVHLWLPGFLLSVCIGAVYQLMPVVLGVPLQLRTSTAWVHLALQAGGVSMLVGGFFTGRFGWVAIGGAGLTAGLGLLSSAIFRTFRASERRDPAAWCFPLAGSWLALTVVLGVALAVNRRWPYLPLSLLDLLRAHAHLGLVGFFLSLLQGVTFQLVPMFTMGTLQRPGCIRIGLFSTQLGLLLLTPGLAWGRTSLILPGAVVLLSGLVCSGVALRATLRTRRRRKLETGLRAFVAGAGCLGLAAALGATLALLPEDLVHAVPVISLYGLLIIVGGLSLTVLGMLCKIIPFLVWMRAYGPWVGKRPVPTATTLAAAGRERAWLYLHGAALLVLATGLLATSLPVVTLGTLLLAAAVLALLSSFVRIALHLRQPRLPQVVSTPLPRPIP